MSVSTIRSDFDPQIKTVDPNIIAWDEDLFGNNDQTKPRADKYYNLIIGNCNGSRDGNSDWEEYDISVDIYSLEQRDILSAFDAVYDKAILVKNELICRVNYNNILNDIEFLNAEPLEDPTNDNSVKVRLNFIVRFNYIIN